ncbi:MAG TPA: hypothetical protein DC038_02285 [Clostridiales bacterium]|nr:hypothetical protein [Clostridiales bacterium]
MQYNITNIVMFFLVYGFLGFLLETAFRTITEMEIVISRGFLTNFFCPLYGISGVIIVQVFNLIEINIDNRLAALLAATAACILVVTLLEYSTGMILDRVFHHKMWDYSNLPLNLHSYICLDFSLMWGIVTLILAGIIHPLMEIVVYAMPEQAKLTAIYTSLILLIINSTHNFRIMGEM